MASTLNLASAWEAIADTIGDRPALRSAAQLRSWASFERSAAGVAAVLGAHGIGTDSKVGLCLHNSEAYPIVQFGAMKCRAVPANVNYRYLEDELVYVLDNADAEAVFFDADVADRVDAIRDRVPAVRLFVQVGGDAAPDWALGWDAVLAADPAPRQTRSSEDLWFLYTGGTTGYPKAVMWNHDGLFGSMATTFRPLGHEVPETVADAAAIAADVASRDDEIRQLAGAPLMHGTSGISSLATLSHGGQVATLGGSSFDADGFWRLIETGRLTMASIVGDAFARPLIETFDEAAAAGCPYDASSLRMVLSSGVMFSAAMKDALLDRVRCTIVDALGSSEGVGMARSVSSRSTKRAATASFRLGEHTKVFTDDGREVEPGSGERGRVALGFPLPVGYYKDPGKTEEAFPLVAGRRWSIPGDYATVEADGSIILLGRGSVCINTGGEKVYPEEVEEALKEHPGVRDCNVVGVADDRWGQAVTAVVELEPGATVDEAELREDVKRRIAGYKVPKRVVFVDRIARGVNGKPDYVWAKQRAETA